MSDFGSEQGRDEQRSPPTELGASVNAPLSLALASEAQAGHAANTPEGVGSPQEAGEITRGRGGRGRDQIWRRGGHSGGIGVRGGSPRGDSPWRGSTSSGNAWRGRSSRGERPWEASSWREKPWEASSWRGNSAGDTGRGGSVRDGGGPRGGSTLSAMATPFTPLSQRGSQGPLPSAQGSAPPPQQDRQPAAVQQRPGQPSRVGSGSALASQAGPNAMTRVQTTRNTLRRRAQPLTREGRIQLERERHESALGFNYSDDEEFIPQIRDP
ncbi:hypothetical protein K449DRAFT_398291 [Hypoxylon sp. EC38]|nr:hypothetical protein K449DRAFT_398291 [Hypoxylon sp. EC38]